MKKFFISAILLYSGLMIIKYRETFYNFTGPNAWAEKWLGSGGTYNLYVLIGTFLAIGSILYFFGVLGGLTNAVFGRFF